MPLTNPFKMAIGAPVISGTTGSVLFIGASTVLAQDNANFFWDYTNNRLGIAVAASPSYTLDVGGFINTNIGSGYKQNGQTILRGLTTGGTANYLTAVGAGAMPSATGADNTAVGYNASFSVTSGTYNTTLGSQAGYTNITGNNNVYLGRLAGYRQVASSNVAVGDQALAGTAGQANNGSNNTAVGFASMYISWGGSDNTALGYLTLASVRAGSHNTAIGSQAVVSLQSGNQNVGIGYATLYNTVSGDGNLALGASACFTAVSASWNTGLGYQALYSNTGDGNTAVGTQTLYSNTSGTFNIALGYQALYSAQTVSGQVAIGYQALYAANNSSANNTAIGYQALTANTSGTNNTSIGYASMAAITTGQYNVAIGVETLFTTQTTSQQVAIGYRAMYAANNSSSQNVAIGYESLRNSTSGNSNAMVGWNSGYSITTGFNSVGLGAQALYSQQTGAGSVALGYQALYAATGDNNIGVGIQAGDNITSGSNNIVIGSVIDAMSATASNQLTIGNYLFGTAMSGTGTSVSPAKFGLGVPAPTAKLSIVGGTSSIPQINLASSTAPSSPATGDIWFDGAADIFQGQDLNPTTAAITSGSGTGVTVNASAYLRRAVHKVTVTFAALAAAATTADKVIATLPAKTRLLGIVADTTTKYIGGTVSACTLIVGTTTGGNEYIVSHDVFTAAITKGLADADLGTSINRANAVLGGDLPSWSATTSVSVRITTTGANTNALTQGSTTYYLVTEVMP